MKKTPFVIAMVFAVIGIFSFVQMTVLAEGKATESIPVYRVRNINTNEHLYTTDLKEVNILEKMAEWESEGIAWEAPTSGTPVYRLYNTNTNDHLFTSNTREKDGLKAIPGWSVDNNEKPIFYSGGRESVYRLFNTSTGQHILTVDYNEYKVLESTGIWKGESSGIAAMAIPTENNISNDAKEMGVSVLKVDHRNKDVFTPEYQEEADNAISFLKSNKEYTCENPLVIANPYGTYSTSLYYYAKTDVLSYAELSIESKGAADFSHRLMTLSGDKLVKEHEYQLTGLVPGQENTVNMRFYDSANKLIGSTVFKYTPDADEHYLTINEIENGDSKNELKDGFFYLFGHDKKKVANIYVFDNEGTPRGLMPLKGYRADRFLFIDDCIAYSYNTRNIVMANRLGKLVKFFEIPGYKFHHDYDYDNETRMILCLANKTGDDTIEDRLVGINVDTGEFKELINFKDLIPEIKAKALQREGGKNSYGGDELDWLHLNALSFMGNGQAVFSSREHSSIYKLSNIYTNPTIDYILHGGKLYEGTKYDELMLKKIGNFVSHAGQHYITYQKDESLPKGQYYLYMYNNNHGASATFPDFDWSLYPGVGTFEEGDHSSFYKYLVDENKKTYTLVKDIHVPYSSIVSDAQDFGDNIEFSSGMSHSYGEYDSEGNMIRIFKYDADKYAYRIMKYDMIDMYYVK